jgi:hypothetical protein
MRMLSAATENGRLKEGIQEKRFPSTTKKIPAKEIGETERLGSLKF